MAIAAFLLPLASGSAPAAKGVIIEMCDPSQRNDALAAMSFIETAATLITSKSIMFLLSFFTYRF